MITYIESWPRRNAKKREIKFVVGDYHATLTRTRTRRGYQAHDELERALESCN
jgi:hypothetical protein